MMEQIELSELPFTTPLIERMVKDGLTIKRLKAEFNDYYYLTSSKIHQQYSYNGDSPILLTEIAFYDLIDALDNPAFKEKVLSYIGN